MNTNTNSGMGLSGLLTIVFLILKLTNTINWSWWWIFSPLWIPVAIVSAIFLVVTMVAMLTVILWG